MAETARTLASAVETHTAGYTFVEIFGTTGCRNSSGNYSRQYQQTVSDTAVSVEAGGPSSSSMPSRIAGTNVQVGVLDEPDIVKTDGRNFYYAPGQRHYYPAEPGPRRDTTVEKRPPERESPETHVIDASDPAAPAVVSRINTTGKLLQTGDSLVVFESQRVVGYDVSDPQNPTEAWSHPLDGSFVTAREANGTVYLVTKSSLGAETQCPIRPLGGDNAIACTDIYRPGTRIPADSTYSAFSIDAADGTVADSVSFVGTARSAAVYIRIATTIPRTGDGESENDLYTLDAQSLARQGSVTGMGDDQRVYSVRYVGDTAYVVTFRQVDPLHVVDLSDPIDPVERGTLELPGYSSYLHPVDDDTLLGIGEEDGKVKAVLFDVSNPAKPEIAESRVFDQHYSSVSETHHAFLMDRKHGVFVLPAGTESPVVNYSDGDVRLETTIQTDQRATRTRYVADSLYVFAGTSVTVVDEQTWDETTTLPLDS